MEEDHGSVEGVGCVVPPFLFFGTVSFEVEKSGCGGILTRYVCIFYVGMIHIAFVCWFLLPLGICGRAVVGQVIRRCMLMLPGRDGG